MQEILDLLTIKKRSANHDDAVSPSDLIRFFLIPGCNEMVGPVMAIVQLKLLMSLLPSVPNNLSFNGRWKVVQSYLEARGLVYGEHFDDNFVRRILEIVDLIEDAKKGVAKQSWGDLHYTTQHNLLASQAHRCRVCGVKLYVGDQQNHQARPELDHIIPFALGGNASENLRIICKACNGAKSDNLAAINSNFVHLNYFLRNTRDDEVTAELRFWVLERDRSQCQCVGCTHSAKDSKLTVTKINSIGRSIYDNLKTVCEYCANSKSNDPDV